MSRSSSPPPMDLVVGARVRVHAGPFLGKVGEVQELDARGGVRISLGQMSVTVAPEDITSIASENAKPRMTSSHRKLPKAK
ncbi:MAG: KOW motif-containing protein [Polyangiaceae bacterium]|nr:KOW motif-containing protein [Polyangiaceae bacterium]